MKNKLFFLILLAFSSKTYASDYYWVNGSGNWSDFSQHWATTSGGNVFYNSEPNYNDNVYFDQFSFLSALNHVIITSNVSCGHFNFSNTLNAEISCDITTREFQIWGDITIDSPFNFSYNGTLTIASDCHIKSSSTLFNGQLIFNTIGAHINLIDNFTSTNYINLKGMFFNTLNNTFRFNDLIVAQGPSCTLKFGTSDVYFTGEFSDNQLPQNYDFDSTTFYLTDSAWMYLRIPLIYKIVSSSRIGVHLTGCDIDTIYSANSRTLYFENGHCKYINFKGVPGDSSYILIDYYGEVDFFDGSSDSSSKCTMDFNFLGRIGKFIEAQNCFFSGENYFAAMPSFIDSAFCRKDVEFYFYYSGLTFSQIYIDYLKVDGNGIYCYMDCGLLELQSNTHHVFRSELAIKIDSLSAIGSQGQEIYFSSDIQGVQDTINMSSNFCGDYINFNDMYVTGGANYYAGTNSIDANNNTGWNFTSCLVGINEISENKNIFLYPVPAIDQITFSEPIDKLKIFDTTGKLVLNLEQKQINNISINSLIGNFFTLELTNKNGIARRKLVVN